MARILMGGVPALAALLSGAVLAHGAGTVTVAQRSRSFEVSSLRVSRGDSVQFVNQDSFLHQIYIEAPGMTFDSDEQAPGEAVTVRFTAAGTFPVMCHIHPKMALRVEVR